MSDGPLRKKSDDRLKIPVPDRDTLLPCEPCKGGGMRLRTFDDGRRHSATRCRWCSGIGHWPRHMAVAYARWKRITAAAQRAGRPCAKAD